ncbi:MAG TPA: 4-hydroxy-3-methylbut-2-enyl diphosphate reductase [Thermodesulfobacteriota bacterium]|nr:4-hydroxy-3-methylbut-2-enyl diphosphate reductase [Thermodesulfobacteriota bacterium]
MHVILAQPRGFCAGVVRAIKIVERALDTYGTTVYVLHEIVHNHHVVEDLKHQGASFIETLDEVPTGAVTIFSAHGVSTAVVKEAEKRNLRVIDATCPLVTKVHLQAQRYSRQGFEVIIIGHPGHPEVEATRGWVEGSVYVLSRKNEVHRLNVKDPDRLAYVTQTTLSLDDTREVIDALKRRWYNIQGPELSDICYATQSRQNAVRQLAKDIDLLLVVGARNSSNSNRLREVGEQSGLPAYLIEDMNELNPEWFAHMTRVGITAGTSAPEATVERVLERLHAYGVSEVSQMDGEPEKMIFRLPESLFP